MRATAELKPLTLVTVTVQVAVEPALTAIAVPQPLSVNPD